jgi:hypothetical protein
LSTQSFLARRAERAIYVPNGKSDIDDLEVTRVPGLTGLGGESLGAWLLHSFAVRMLSEPVTPEIAQLWRGDIVSLFVDESTGGTELVWKIRFPGAGRATDFSRRVNRSVARNNGSWSATSAGSVSVIAASTRPGADLTALLAAATESNPSDTASARHQVESPKLAGANEASALARALKKLSPTCAHNALLENSGR